MGKQINGTMRLTPPNGMSRDCRVSLYTDEEISGGGGSVVVDTVPTDLSSYSVGQSINVPNSDGTSYTAYVVVESSGVKKLIKSSGSSTQVIDSLDSTSVSAALSANQGKVLNDELYDVAYMQDSEDPESVEVIDIEGKLGELSLKISEKQDKISVVGETDTTKTIQPNIYYKWDKAESLTLTMEDGASDVLNEYMFEFTCNSDSFALTLSPKVTWITTPTFEKGKLYQVSIVNSLAVCAGFTTGSATIEDNTIIVSGGGTIEDNTLKTTFGTIEDNTLKL